MQFPVTWDLFGHTVHAHNVFEVLAYLIGGRVYVRARRGTAMAGVTSEMAVCLIISAGVGAYLGSKVLAILETPPANLNVLLSEQVIWDGKTIVGGLLGAWIGVELFKVIAKFPHRTGDAFVPALAIGIPIGRVGCFLEGLPDQTYGVASTLPWAIDFGDGIYRHPTQLYESTVVALLGIAIFMIRSRIGDEPGRRFRWFMLGYCLWRVVVEFIKPRSFTYAGLSAIQWASAMGVLVCVWQLIRVKHAGDFRN